MKHTSIYFTPLLIKKSSKIQVGHQILSLHNGQTKNANLDGVWKEFSLQDAVDLTSILVASTRINLWLLQEMIGGLWELTETLCWKDMNPRCIEDIRSMSLELCSQMIPNSCFLLEVRIRLSFNGEKYEIYVQNIFLIILIYIINNNNLILELFNR